MPIDPMFRALLIQARRQALIKSKGRPKYPKMPIARYPVLIERRYASYLQKLMAPIAKISTAWAKTQYAQVLQEYKRTDSDDLHLDADSHKLVFGLMASLQEAQTAIDLGIGGTAAASMATTAESVNAWVAKRFALERQLALGSVFNPQEPWVQAAISEWVETNRKLVSSLSGEALTRMESLVLEAVQTGRRPEDLISQIYNLNRATGLNRARLIAADQIGKLQGLLTEQRSLAIGMDTYTWQTAMDERVRGNPRGKYPTARPSHWEAQGKVGIYGKSDVWLVAGKQVPRGSGEPIGAPGMEIRCFLGDREVASHIPAEVLYRHWYSGPGTIITTDTGEALRCTANHPILRADGVMVPAHLLNKGDKIIQFGTERLSPVSLASSADVDDEDRVTFKQLFDLCLDFGISEKVLGSREDFHGDGSAEDVDIVYLERGLSNGAHLSGIDERIAQQYLAKAYARLTSEMPAGDAFSKSSGDGDTAHGLVAGLRKILPFLGRESAHSEDVRLRSIASLDAMLLEDPADDIPGNAILLAKLEFARSGMIPTTDLMLRKILSLVPCSVLNGRSIQSIPAKVVMESHGTASDAMGDLCKRLASHGAVVEIQDIGTCEISAHVYNLQSGDGWYCVRLDNGKYTIVSNCRCIGASRWEDVLKPIDQELLMDPYVRAEMGLGPWPE